MTLPDFLFLTFLKAVGIFEIFYLGWLLSKRLGPLMSRSRVPAWGWTVIALAQINLGVFVAAVGKSASVLYAGLALALLGLLIAAADHYRREHEQTCERAARPANR